MPLIGSSRRGRGSSASPTACVKAAVWTRVAVAELEEQAVAAGRGVVGREGERVGVERVDVLVGEVAGAQHDEVAAGAEVGLQVGDGAPSRRTAKRSSPAVGSRSVTS